MRITPTQSVALRFGAVMILLGGIVLAVVAATVDSGSPDGGEVTLVDDPAAVPLPDPGLFGSEVVIYGAAERSVPPADLGCRLVSRSGNELSTALMSDLAVLGTAGVTVDGTDLEPLFAVDSYPRGATLECDDAASAEPVAVSSPSTFGGAGTAVRALAAAGALTCLVVGVVGWFAFRPRAVTR